MDCKYGFNLNAWLNTGVSQGPPFRPHLFNKYSLTFWWIPCVRPVLKCQSICRSRAKLAVGRSGMVPQGRHLEAGPGRYVTASPRQRVARRERSPGNSRGGDVTPGYNDVTD
ncbi:hypothetical protein J6590_007345 [Homalodisca vitripennis]|nr:hypothetical protein J6590_007345 [Homalodisca vitripennis]